mgnify:FL=1
MHEPIHDPTPEENFFDDAAVPKINAVFLRSVIVYTPVLLSWVHLMKTINAGSSVIFYSVERLTRFRKSHKDGYIEPEVVFSSTHFFIPFHKRGTGEHHS